MATPSLVSIVDSHNKVLKAWATLRQTLELPPRLITLDHHTDTSRPFRNLIAKTHGRDLSQSQFNRIQASLLGSVDFSNPLAIEEAITKLNNEEHIVTAIKSNIISSAFVVAHNAINTDIETYKEHRIVCRGAVEARAEKNSTEPE